MGGVTPRSHNTSHKKSACRSRAHQASETGGTHQSECAGELHCDTRPCTVVLDKREVLRYVMRHAALSHLVKPLTCKVAPPAWEVEAGVAESQVASRLSGATSMVNVDQSRPVDQSRLVQTSPVHTSLIQTSPVHTNPVHTSLIYTSPVHTSLVRTSPAHHPAMRQASLVYAGHSSSVVRQASCATRCGTVPGCVHQLIQSLQAGARYSNVMQCYKSRKPVSASSLVREKKARKVNCVFDSSAEQNGVRKLNGRLGKKSVTTKKRSGDKPLDTNDNVDETLDDADTSYWYCQDCGVIFSSKLELRLHRRARHGTLCSVCKKWCKDAIAAKRHLTVAHGSEPFCKRCQKRFASFSHLKVHSKMCSVSHKKPKQQV